MSMERNYFSVLFYIKKAKLLKNGEAPICLRITVNGKRAEIQIKRSVEIDKWNARRECAIGKDRKYLELNHYLETVRTRVLRIHRELEQDDKPITAEILKKLFYGEKQTPKMLLEVFKEHNAKYRELIGIDPFAAGNRLANVTNDIDPQYDTDFHMDATDFLNLFKPDSVDTVLYDPPYSPRQVAECYKALGITVNMQTTQASY